MYIDLLKLNYLEKIDVNEEINIKSDIYKDTDIVELKDVKVTGEITLDDADEYQVNFDLFGTMMLHDSLTYDIIPYNFTVKIAETLEKSVKTLDLNEFLWHYIVLEVPLRFTLSDGYYPHNDDYRIISEEEYKKKNNPFSDFRIE